MNETDILIANSLTGSSVLCGVMITTSIYTAEGQTYSFSCNFNGGDQIILQVNHADTQYEGYLNGSLLCELNNNHKVLKITKTLKKAFSGK